MYGGIDTNPSLFRIYYRGYNDTVNNTQKGIGIRMSDYLTKLKKRTNELSKLEEFASMFDTVIEHRLAAKDSIVQVTGFQIRHEGHYQVSGATQLYIEWAIDDIAQEGIRVDFTWLSNWYDVDNQWLDVPEVIIMLNTTLDSIIEELSIL